MEDKDKLAEEKEHRLVKEKLEEDNNRGKRKSHNMPGQFSGRGPQENSALGYDALEDI